MKNLRIIAAVAFALTIASLATAKADVIRLAIVVAENASDYANNAALVPEFAALLAKGKGVKEVHVGMDPKLMAIGSSSIWANVEDVASVTDTPEWKATVAKLKAKPFVPVILQLP